jgi:AraC-like DNA-binding protein
VAHAARIAPAPRRGTVADAASAIGYDSEAAFSRTFKKVVGQL